MKKYIFSFLLLNLFPLLVQAQNKPEMADLMRSNGKIYVVVAVLALVFLGIAAFLLYIEKKVNKIDPKN